MKVPPTDDDELARMISDGTVNKEMLQDYVCVLLERFDVRLTPKALRHHMEHIVMIKLGRLFKAKALTFAK